MPRILIDYDPVVQPDVLPAPYSDCPGAGANWLALPAEGTVQLARLRFTLKKAGTIRFHVSADMRYLLLLDGVLLGRGPERGDHCHWGLESYEETLSAGEHVFLARILTLPFGQQPWGVVHQEYGFLLMAEAPNAELSTGRGAWETRTARGVVYSHEPQDFRIATGIPGVFNPEVLDAEEKSEDGWDPAETGNPAYSSLASMHYPSRVRLLYPDRLPPQLNQPVPVKIEPISLAPGETVEKIIDLGTYYCFYPEVTFSGEGEIQVGATEGLYRSDTPEFKKLPRNCVQGGELRRWNRDSFVTADGKPHTATTFFFRCGRLLVIRMKAGKTGLTLHELKLTESRYPWNMTAEISGGADFDALAPVFRRSLEMCSHDTYMDCPFYEQMMYAGDTRVEALISDVVSADRRLQRKAANLFNWSRNWTGLTASSYPDNGRQVIPGFSLIWTAMVWDNLMWDPDAEENVHEQLAGVRSVLDAWQLNRSGDGLLKSPRGWNFTAGAPYWKEHGVPPESDSGHVGAVPNMMYLCFSQYGAALERHFGFSDRAEMIEKGRKRIAEKLLERYYDPDSRLFADNSERTLFSEPIQCLAILSGAFGPEVADGLFVPTRPLFPDFYFSHYYFEACRVRGRGDAMLKRLQDWNWIREYRMSTTPEGHSNDSRSDCHAWSASPLFHWFASLAGIRPAAPGFARVSARPLAPELQPLRGRMPHPGGGFIEFDFNEKYCKLILPEGIPGELTVGGVTRQAHDGSCVKIERE